MTETEQRLGVPLDELSQKLADAFQRDIEPLLPASEYPPPVRGQIFDDAMLFSLGREKYLRKFGHVLLSRECVDALVALLAGQRVADVCAGTGFLAYTLANEGVDVTAIDIHPPGPEPTELDGRSLWKVDIMGSALDQPLEKYDALLLVWPDHGAPFADQVAERTRPGQLLVYQGEGKGACTASDEFFDRLARNEWELLEADTKKLNSAHARFYGMNDWWYVLRRTCG